MLLLKLFSLALLASQHVASAPTEEDFRLSIRDDTCGGDELSKRAPCNQDVQCGADGDTQGTQKYSANKIKGTVKWAKRSFPDKEGNYNGYPKYYGASDNPVKNALPADCTGTGVTLYEFPIKEGDHYNGGDPGADRVVLGETTLTDGTKSRFFCLVMTHRGVADNGFKVCPATTD